MANRSNRSWERGSNPGKEAFAQQIAEGAPGLFRRGIPSKKHWKESAELIGKHQVIRTTHRYLDLPNLLGTCRLEATKLGIARKDWAKFLSWSSTIAPGSTAGLDFAAAYVPEQAKKGPIRIIRKELEATFVESGWKRPPFVFPYWKDVDSVLIQHMRAGTGEYLLRHLAAKNDVTVTLILVTGDADYFKLLRDWKRTFGEMLDLHVVASKYAISRKYLKVPWLQAHYWEEIMELPASS